MEIESSIKKTAEGQFKMKSGETPKQIVHHRENCVEIIEDQEIGAIVVKWNGYCSSGKYQEMWQAAFDLAKEKKLVNWISDATDGDILQLEVQKWIAEKIIPKMAAFIKQIAIVRPKDRIRQIAINRIDEVAQKMDWRVRHFKNYEEARLWMKILA